MDRLWLKSDLPEARVLLAALPVLDVAGVDVVHQTPQLPTLTPALLPPEPRSIVNGECTAAIRAFSRVTIRRLANLSFSDYSDFDHINS